MPRFTCGYCPATFRTEAKRDAHIEKRRGRPGGLREHDEDRPKPWMGAQETPIVVQVLGPDGTFRDPPGMLFQSAKQQIEKKFGRKLDSTEKEMVREFTESLEGSKRRSD